MRRLAIVTVVTLALVSAACIKRDSAATWYVDSAGRVTWSILERDVRSDAAARVDRETEEQQYLFAVRSQTHGAAHGLKRLGAAGLKVSILQDKAPFTVLTEGAFPGLGEMGTRLITQFRLSGTSVVVRDGDTWTWTMTLSDPNASSGDTADDEDLVALMGDRLTVALREGRFLSATGFALDDEGRIATLNSDDKLKADENGMLTIGLCWEIK